MITVKNLKKTFGELTVLKDVNAQIKKGEVISIIGPSGTGKSTFLRCLNLLETPSSGEIFVDDKNILARDADVNMLRRKMGMVFQSFNLFSHLMIIENIMLGPVKLLKTSRKAAFDDAMELLRLVGLGEKAYAYPDELSGGQKQRAAIARTLAMHPEIVLFDEPTSALDPTMVSEVLSVIRKLAQQGMTMAIVTHEMKFARDVSTRVFYMDEGIIYEEGPPEQIFDAPQRKKTQEFIRKVRKFTWEINSKEFDLYSLIAELEAFCLKHALREGQILSLQALVEEVVYGCLFPSMSDTDTSVSLSVSYSEQDDSVSAVFEWKGDIGNPLESKEEELMLPLEIIKMHTASQRFECAVNENEQPRYALVLEVKRP